MENKIQVIDSQMQILKEFSFEQLSDAYTYAEEMENLGIEISVIAPSLPETLLNSLGAKKGDTDKLRSEIEKELTSHNE